MQSQKSGLIYIAAIAITLFLSFRFYSAWYFCVLNTDNAVNILMIHYYSLPGDFYFWGQDRMGTLIPLIGQIPFRVFDVPAILCDSLVRYAILLAGYAAIAILFQSWFYRLLLAVFWFLPPMHMIDITQFAYGIQYALIGIAIYLFNLRNTSSSSYSYVHLILGLVMLILAVWVSDLALISIIALIIIYYFYYWRNNTRKFKSEFPLWILFTIAGYFFLDYIKSYSDSRINYAVFNTLEGFLETFRIFTNSILDILTFRANEPFTSLYSILVISLFVFLIVIRNNKFQSNSKRMWLIFFSLDAIFVLGVILMSEFTLSSGVPRRYFTCTYISAGIAILMYAENLKLIDIKRTFLNGMLLITVFIGGIGGILHYKFVWPETLKPYRAMIAELETLGNIGVISEYWNSYISSITNPELIKATPHDQDNVRNKKLAEEVFHQQKLYLIRDMWMETFPDTMQQFGRTLVRIGEPFRKGGANLCEYEVKYQE
jgi:hypothetical protein